MSNIIFISSSSIQAFSYSSTPKRVRITKSASCPLEEGAVINGIITDPTEVVTKLTELKKKNRSLFSKASLIIDSNELAIKRIKAPRLSASEYRKLVNDEFNGSASSDGMICGYSTVTKNGSGRELLAGAATRGIIEGYISLFARAKIKLVSIGIGLEPIVSYMSKHLGDTSGSTVLNIVDGPIMLSMIFDNGEYIISMRTRVIEDASGSMSEFLSRELGHAKQFCASEKLSDLTESFYIGVDDNVIAETQAISSSVAVSGFAFSVPFAGAAVDTAAASMALFRMIHGEKRINLLASYKDEKRANTHLSSSKTVSIVMVYFLIAAAMFAGWYLLRRQNNALDREIAAAQSYLNAPIVLEQTSELSGLNAQIASLQNIIGTYKLAGNEIAMTPVLNSDILNYLNNSAGADVLIYNINFDAPDSVLVLACCGNDEYSGSAFIETLRAGGRFGEYGYVGYGLDEKIQKYRFMVTLSFAPAVEAGEDTPNEEVTGNE